MAARNRIKGITIEIGGDTTKLASALASVNKSIRNTQTNIRDLDKALKLDPTNMDLIKDKQVELATEIQKTKEKLDTEKQALDQLKNSDGFDENSQQARNLKTQIDLDTSALKQLEDEAAKTSSAIGSAMSAIGSKVSEVGEKIKGVGDKIQGVGRDLTMKVTAPLAAAMGSSVKEAIDWESAFTGVMKTVDETATTSYEDLKKDINEIAKTTASSQNSIAATMEIAGQLGVSADDVSEFTKTMVMLGDTTNLTSEEAASSIAKFANVTRMSLQDTDKLGSVIVDLGNNYATTEADIMSMATRLSGAGAQIGLTQGEILGFATALSSVGIEAEMGGSAFSKAMIKMQVATETGASGFDELQQKLRAAGDSVMADKSFRELYVTLSNDSKALKDTANEIGMTKKELLQLLESRANLENFAEVANMSMEDFVRLYQNDAPAAIQAFIGGLGDVEGHGETTIAMLQEMGFTEVRLRDTLTRLAQSNDLVTDAVKRGNEAWDENSAMQEEADKRYGTMESKLSQLNARFTEVKVEIGEMLMPVLEDLMGVVEDLMDAWNSLDDEQKENILTIAEVVAVVGPVLMIIGTVVSAIGSIVSGIGGLITIGGTIVTFLSGTLIPAIGGVAAAMAPAIAAVAAPIAIAAAIVAAIVLIATHWDQIKEKAKEVADKVKEKWNNLKDDTAKAWSNIKEKTSENWQKVKDKVSETTTKIKENVKERWDKVKSDTSQAWSDIKEKTSDKVGTIKDKVTETFSNMKDSVKEKVGGIKDEIKDGFQKAIDWIKDLPNQAIEWGRDLIGSVIDGIKEKVGGVKEAAEGIAGNIAEYIHFTEPDKGPLSNFHTFMPDMMAEIISGIQAGIPKVQQTMESLGSAMLPNAQAVQGKAGNSSTVNGGINITVYGAQGQDVNQLADIIQQRMNIAIQNQEAVFA